MAQKRLDNNSDYNNSKYNYLKYLKNNILKIILYILILNLG